MNNVEYASFHAQTSLLGARCRFPKKYTERGKYTDTIVRLLFCVLLYSDALLYCLGSEIPTSHFLFSFHLFVPSDINFSLTSLCKSILLFILLIYFAPGCTIVR